MIMLLTHRLDLRDQIAKTLEAKGHALCLPSHRTDVKAEMKMSHPDLVVLDMYLDNPSGNRMLQNLREDGYDGSVIALFGPSQMSSLNISHSLGLHKVLKVPEQVAGTYDLGELETAVEASLNAR